jgi:hypothetical protein
MAGLGRVHLQNDVTAAISVLRDALALTEGADDLSPGRSSALHVLGVALQMSGDLVGARAVMSARLAAGDAGGDEFVVQVESANLSMVERQLGNLDRAEELARESLEIARRREDEWMYPYTLSSLAAVAVERGEHERAATLIGAAESMMAAQNAAWPPDERPHYEQTVARLSEEMGDGFERVRIEGRALGSDAAVELALAR